MLLLSPSPIYNSWGNAAFEVELRFRENLGSQDFTWVPLLYCINKTHPIPTGSLFPKGRKKKKSQKSSHPQTFCVQHLTLKSALAIPFTWGLIFFLYKIIWEEKNTFSLLCFCIIIWLIFSLLVIHLDWSLCIFPKV